MKSYSIFTDKSIVIGLLVLGIAVHALWFGNPSSAVFDEVHFGKFISAYFTHEYYFDIHPPLGKLILAAWGKLWGFRPGFSFANIGDDFPDNTYLALRFLPALAGALLPLVIYGVARRLNMGKPAAFLAGAFIALDNALLVQSRFILLDSFLLLFGFGAVYCYLTWRQKGGLGQSKWYLLAAGVLGGMAMGIKWTGASFIGLIVILELFRLWNSRRSLVMSHWSFVIVCLAVAPMVVYYSAFVVHFALLTKSGTGDAFMSKQFRHDLEGSTFQADESIQSLPMFEKVAELNIEMYRSNQRLTATHPYSSKWYSWPFMERTIFYWIKGDARIYLQGNPVVWWASTAAVLGTLWCILRARVVRAPSALLVLGGAWVINLLPFVGIARVMFLYHYFIALVWAVVMLAWFADKLKRPEKPVLAAVGVALATFAFFAPLSYGLSMNESARTLRIWLTSWE